MILPELFDLLEGKDKHSWPACLEGAALSPTRLLSGVAKACGSCYGLAMTALEQSKSITIAEYLSGEESAELKHEYLGGTVHAMAGATNQHNMIGTSAILSIGSQLRGKACQPFNSDTKVRIELTDHIRFYYPDAMVVCHPNPSTDSFQNQPVIIIEILSDSTRRTDLGEKRDAYLTIPSLKVLLFIESEIAAVTLYRRKSEGGYAIEEYSGVESTIPLPEIDVSLPLADVYERVEFAS